MFTGIVEAKGTIVSARANGRMRTITVRTPASWRIKAGQSIAVDGVCLTATKSANGGMSADLMGETLRKTTAPEWSKGTGVNLERALRFGDRVDGHLVLGHVEGTARVAAVEHDDASRRVTLVLSAALARRVREKGSIAINGVSLTVARKDAARVTVALVPYTLAHTNLASLEKGSRVNIETDILAGGSIRRNAKRRTR